MKKIAVVPNQTKDVGLHVTGRLISALLGKVEVYMHDSYKDSGLQAHFVKDDLYENADIVIVLGGDGTILQTAEPCSRLHIPVMGINLGKVGFMTEIEVDEIEIAAKKLLDEDYKIEKRMMMKVDVCKNDGSDSTYYALNDAVISKSNSQMISLELYRENEKINAYIADGVIIATPTGSTGYSLSAGGPVADPAMELFMATPICAHRLSSRTAILPSDKKVLIKLVENGNSEALITIDGHVKECMKHGERVEIKKSAEKVMLIKMGTQSFYDVLTDKLS